MLPKGTMVLGGAASGKSVWAEKMLECSGLALNYIATGQIYDAETTLRVQVHKARRDARWTTIEAPFDLTPALSSLTDTDAVLVDCATMWLSNHMLAESDIEIAQTALLHALRAAAAPWVVVTNEVGKGIVPENALARRFREAHGRLNIALAAEADLAVQVIAGLPQVLKGQLP